MKEALGRLYLWQIAIGRVIELLELRQRVNRFCSTGRPLHITKLYDNERRRLGTGLRLNGEALDCFEKEHGSLFPDVHDVRLMEELITEEIIIKFCTIFNDGYGRVGVIAANKKSFWEPILDEVISGAFSGDVEVSFNGFVEQAKTYRNKHGAHFDQESFNMTHGDKKPGEDGIVYSVGWSSALFCFDWDFINEVIPVFNESLNGYIKELQKKSGIV